jgi:hypothetical protein
MRGRSRRRKNASGSAAKGHEAAPKDDAPGVFEQLVPDVTPVIEDVVVGAEHPVRQPVVAQEMHGLGNQGGAWRARRGAATDYVSPAFYGDLAHKAEAAKLHAIFQAEQMVANPGSIADRPCGALDTVGVLSFMAAITTRIGCVVPEAMVTIRFAAADLPYVGLPTGNSRIRCSTPCPQRPPAPP